MVRSKPELVLAVPNALDAEMCTRADLVTPPCYIVSVPPPLVTPAHSRSSSLSKVTSQSESDCELGDEDEGSLKSNVASWTRDQDELHLSVCLTCLNYASDVRHIHHT
jgi:hypothetical protein